MKKLTILAVLLIVFSATSFAEESKISETSKFQLNAKSDVKYELIYTSENSGAVRVTIYNEWGQRLNSQRIKKAKNFKRTYDFSELTPGNYKIVVSNENGSAHQIITYKVKEARLKTFVSKIPNSRSLKLHVGDFDSSAPVRIRIYDQDNKLLLSEEITSAKGFSKVYNLSKINATQLRSVSILVANNGESKTFTYTFQ